MQTSLTDATFRIVDRRRLRMIRDGALFLNFGRGSLVDYAALTECLVENRFRAVLDVYPEEPLAADRPLRHTKNVICFPHLGAATEYCRRSMGEEVLAKLEDFIEGRPLRNAVDEDSALEMGGRWTDRPLGGSAAHFNTTVCIATIAATSSSIRVAGACDPPGVTKIGYRNDAISYDTVRWRALPGSLDILRAEERISCSVKHMETGHTQSP